MPSVRSAATRVQQSYLVGVFSTVARTFHPVGLAFAVLFFAWSMSPSLLPRPWFLQALATGISMAIGYGVGRLLAWLTLHLGFAPRWSAHARIAGWTILSLTAAVTIPTFTILGARWQDIVRDIVGTQRDGGHFYLLVVFLAFTVAITLVFSGRALRWLSNRITHLGTRFVPTHTARLASIALLFTFVVFVVDGAAQRVIVNVAERSAAAVDVDTAPGVTAPIYPERSGSRHSAQAWNTLGNQGRSFVAGGPTWRNIEIATGQPAMTPIRVYAGRDSGPTFDDVAALVVDELERTGAFDRSVLAVATATGSGWVNPNVAAALEFVTGGDSAIASMQYSYLPSPVSFIADRETPQQAGRALFDAVYERWSSKPIDSRPALVVFGESLGSYGGQAAFSGGYEMLAKVDGALWSGTPNFTEQWQLITASRDANSRQARPIIASGDHIRFAAQPADVRGAGLAAEWRSPRIVYWQHSSDPIVWWNSELIHTRPEWLNKPLAPGIDPNLQWVPFVTFWQITADMVFSIDVPSGHGHSYGPEAAYLWADILDGITDKKLSPEQLDRVHAAIGRR
ncbi:alpha/beta-hydrolase family protein [Hoyosella rhizosphaerae]|uniref:Membrane protein n=2 Tax=Hoyosella rhizosphaerae TaxID=1755582 RepID=A0A916U2D2_9ACTN|nr:alpha/beta-hydrolase family protein [Hoyosella rhizosphaerae]GGC56978.1 membrane protein [Hoyosella rhizosphaerae]